MREAINKRLPIRDFYAEHLGTPTAGVGSVQRVAEVRRRRITPDGHWGWVKRALPAQSDGLPRSRALHL